MSHDPLRAFDPRLGLHRGGGLDLADPDGEADWDVVRAFVQGLGSSLDLSTLARRSRDLFDEHFGLRDTAICLVDGPSLRLELHGPVPAGWPEPPTDWPLDLDLLERLRGHDPLVRVDGHHLPDGVDEPGGRVALRLNDGEDTLGLLMIEGSHVVESADPMEVERLRTVAGLVGNTFSRALVHQALVAVTEKLEDSRRLQQHILDHVSHEFNTPLMIVKSASEFADTDDAEERSAFLDMHAQAVQRLEDLVQGVLDVARSRTMGEVQWLTPSELCRAVIEPLEEKIGWPKDRHHLLFELPDDMQIRVDPDGLSLALSHLVRNSWQYGGQDGGAVLVAVYLDSKQNWMARSSVRLEEGLTALRRGPIDRLLPVSTPARVDSIVFEVVDDGIGIPEDELEHVFEPFTQASNSPLRSVSGAGMGLSICRKRVETMGGEIHLQSKQGTGTCVSVLLPWSKGSGPVRSVSD